MKKVFILLFAGLVLVSNIYAAQSNITEAEGYSCMGEDKSRKQTKEEAFVNAQRKALEQVVIHIKSETRLNNMELEKDIVEAYSGAKVKMLDSKELDWYKDEHSGECIKVWLRAEVIPDEKAMERLAEEKQLADDPLAPLHVKVWTDKDKRRYKVGEKIKIFIRGNKPFYAKVLYRDTTGESIQLFPNPYRTDNYFTGGSIHEIPSGEDQFDLEVSPPFGEEEIVLYTSTSQLGDLDLDASGGVYIVKTKTEDIGVRTRSAKAVARIKNNQNANTIAEFSEDRIAVKTGK